MVTTERALPTRVLKTPLPRLFYCFLAVPLYATRALGQSYFPRPPIESGRPTLSDSGTRSGWQLKQIEPANGARTEPRVLDRWMQRQMPG